MVSLGGGKQIEQTLNAGNIDALTCRDKFKGDLLEDGSCVVRIKLDPNNPDRAELMRLQYISRGAKSNDGRLPP